MYTIGWICRSVSCCCFSLFRYDKKKVSDKAEISDYEEKVAHSLDVYNTDSGISIAPLKHNFHA